MKRLLLYILIISNLLSLNKVNDKDFSNHLELFVHEDIINQFLSSFGEIDGNGKIGIFNYEWILENLKIDISPEMSQFKADIILISSNLKRKDTVFGDVIIEYNKDKNIIYVSIVNVNFNIDLSDVFNILPRESVKLHIDLSDYFDEPFQISGPQPEIVSYTIDVDSNNKKEIKINITDSKLFLVEDGIKIFSMYESATD